MDHTDRRRVEVNGQKETAQEEQKEIKQVRVQ